jgi:hypothetical protein
MWNFEIYIYGMKFKAKLNVFMGLAPRNKCVHLDVKINLRSFLTLKLNRRSYQLHAEAAFTIGKQPRVLID